MYCIPEAENAVGDVSDGSKHVVADMIVIKACLCIMFAVGMTSTESQSCSYKELSYNIHLGLLCELKLHKSERLC